jgi:Reverse transcriptase (RNA-dependent DNA polymerase)
MLDSGCTFSCTGIRLILSDFTDSEDSIVLEIADKGLVTSRGHGFIGGILTYYVPELCDNILISVSQITDFGNSVTFSSREVIVTHIASREIILRGLHTNGIYEIDLDDLMTEIFRAKTHKALVIRDVTRLHKAQLRHHYLHARCSHQGYPMLRFAVDNNLCDGLNITSDQLRELGSQTVLCVHCQRAKLKKRPYVWSKRVAPVEVGEFIEIDMQGPMVRSIQGNRYIFMIVDSVSDATFIYPMESKDQALQYFKYWYLHEATANRHTIKHLRSDNDTVFLSAEFSTFLSENGIRGQLSHEYNPSQNGLVEKRLHHLNDLVRANLMDYQTLHKLDDIPGQLWEYSALYAVYCMNRLRPATYKFDIVEDGVHTGEQLISSYEAWTSLRPTMEHVRKFGSKCVFHTDQPILSKFEARGSPGILVGFNSSKEPGYQLLAGPFGSSHIVDARNVVFDEIRNYNDGHLLSPKFSTPGDDIFVDESGGEEKATDSIELSADSQMSSSTVRRARKRKTPEDHQYRPERVITRSVNPVLTPIFPTPNGSKSTPVRKLEDYQRADDIVIPRNFDNAISCEDKRYWRAAIADEISSQERMKVGVILNIKDLDRNELIGSRWVFTIKNMKATSEVKYKARLVAQGFTQIWGYNFDETYSPVANHDSLQVFLSMSANYGWIIHQMDVDTAYLNASLDKIVYMKIPDGLRNDKVHFSATLNGDHSSQCLRLDKALYGLKQAGLCWYRMLCQTLTEQLGYKKLISDGCVFTKEFPNSGFSMILVYVDDLLIASSKIEYTLSAKELLSQIFKMKDLGIAARFLGIDIDQDLINKKVYLSGSTYIQKIIVGLKMESDTDFPPLDMPIGEGVIYSSDMSPQTPDEEREMLAYPYREVLGQIGWLSIVVRSDTLQAYGQLSQFNHNPGMRHWIALLDVIRYYKRTQRLALTFGRNPTDIPRLSVYVDSSLGNCEDTLRSRSGVVVMWGDNLIRSISKRQDRVAHSTFHAETNALVLVAHEVTFFKNLLSELGVPVDYCITVFEDNRATKYFADHPTGSGSRYLELHVAAIRDMVTDKIIKVVDIPTADNRSNFFTKSVALSEHIASLKFYGYVMR